MELLDGANGISTNLFDFYLSSDNYFQTYDKLRNYLLKAIQECSEGFGFA